MTGGRVIPFTGQRFRIYRPSREVIHWRGRDSERWVVIVREPDGAEHFRGPCKTKADAVWLAGVLAEADRKDRERERIGLDEIRAFMSLPGAVRARLVKEWRSGDNPKKS